MLLIWYPCDLYDLNFFQKLIVLQINVYSFFYLESSTQCLYPKVNRKIIVIIIILLCT